MFRRSAVVLGLFVVLAAPVSAQRPGREPPPAGIKTMLSLDSASIRNANVSADGKWLVFALDSAGGATSSIWMAAMSDRKPVRITSEGYTDRWPTVSPAGDKVFFISNRPSRDAHSRAMYVMSVQVDKGTGKPAGPVRQVTTDSVTFLPANGISADGKWLAYTVQGNPPLLRLVSTAGGNARTLVTKFTFGGLYTSFTPDGKRVVFQDSLAHLIMEVPVAGGPATLIRGSTDGEQQAPVPNSDGRVIAGKDATGAYTLLDKSGHTLGTTQIPPSFGTAKVIRSDGLGWIGVNNESWYELKRVDLATGAITEALSPRPDEPLGVAADGSILTYRKIDGKMVLATYSSAGKAQHEVTAPTQIASLATLFTDGTRVIAWSAQYPHAPVKNASGRDTVTRDRTAYLLNRTTGALQKIADSVWVRAGASALAVPRGAMLDLKSIDANGTLHLARSFPFKDFRRFDDRVTHGGRVAWVDSTGKDEVTIFVAIDPTSPPARIGVVARSDSDDVAATLSWSPDGRKLAVAFNDAANKNRPTARVYGIAENGSLTTAGPALDLAGATDDISSVAWVPDGSALLVYRDDPSVKGDPYYVTLRSLDPARPPVHLAPSAGAVDDVFLEPGGKSVLLEVSRDGGASIWTADFVPVKKP